VDQTGKLGLDEFARLWGDLRKYQQAFAKFDADKSGKMNSHELREAYKELGISLSNKAFQSLVMRFSNKKGEIEFDDFVLCTIRLKTVFDTFKAHPKDTNGNGLFSIDEFVHEMMYS
jgi:Ca2+-binding EF-hand superfamily protein